MKINFDDIIKYIVIIFIIILAFAIYSDIVRKQNNNDNGNTPLEEEIKNLTDTIVITDYHIDTIYININNKIADKNEEVQKVYNLNDTATINLFYQLISR